MRTRAFLLGLLWIIQVSDTQALVVGEAYGVPSVPTWYALLPYVNYPVGATVAEAMAIGDFDGDHLNDAVVVDLYGYMYVLFQRAIGGLTFDGPYFIGDPLFCVRVADVDGDGLDEIVAGTQDGIVVVERDKDGVWVKLGPYPTSNSTQIALGDLNSDGRIDVVGIGVRTHEVDVLLQSNYGDFVLSATYEVRRGGHDDLEVGDVNDDGRDDVVIMSGQISSYDSLGVLLQGSDGSFAEAVYYDLGVDESADGMGIGDVNGDGRNDVVVSYGGNYPAYIGVFAQSSDGTLERSVSYLSADLPSAVEVGDVTGDGLDDIVVLHPGFLSLGVYKQLPGGKLGSETLFHVPNGAVFNPHSLAIGDLNGDGRNDVAFNTLLSLVVLFARPEYHQQPAERDFDGDHLSDPAVYAADAGRWEVLLTSSGKRVAFGFGGVGFHPVPADYNGDGRSQVALWHDNGWWLVVNATGEIEVQPIGRPGDVARPADFDGDGRADLCVYRFDQESTWVIRLSRTGETETYGLSGSGFESIAVPADYDGDGKADLAVLDGNIWRIRSSITGTVETQQFPIGDWTPVRGDFDGDGRADRVAYEKTTHKWAVELSSSVDYHEFFWGAPGFSPVGGVDHDGDGSSELVLYRPSSAQWIAYLSLFNTVASVYLGGPQFVAVH